MKRQRLSGLSLLLALAMVLSILCLPVSAAVTEEALAEAVADAADYIYRTVQTPQVGAVGGEWAVLGLARSGYEAPEEYYQRYYTAVEDYVRACNGVLHEKKYTEYARVIVALSALGRDARNVAGYDLTMALADYDKTVWQGLNGPIWALIALDSRSYPMPENPEAAAQATRQMYIDCILDSQCPDGGWSLTGGGVSDPDMTGMALQALAKYQDQPAVAEATEAALACMSGMQDETGGFTSWGSSNSESCVQMLVALCELGVPLDDPRFVTNGKTLLDNLMTFYRPGNGFRHKEDGSGSGQMASEQGLYALAAVKRAWTGQNSLYRMGDAIAVPDGGDRETGTGLEGKHADVQPVPLAVPGKTFSDVSAHANQTAIEALAARKIIDGKGNGLFCPDDGMTRAEFAAIVVRALGLTPAETDAFHDVPAGTWYAPYVGTASSYGIIKGVGGGMFSPNGTITRQEAAVMAARAAALCGMDTDLDAGTVRDVLAPFGDYVHTPDWARQGLAFCYRQEILDASALEIDGTAAVKRCEVAQMVFALLSGANLL